MQSWAKLTKQLLFLWFVGGAPSAFAQAPPNPSMTPNEKATRMAVPTPTPTPAPIPTAHPSPAAEIRAGHSPPEASSTSSPASSVSPIKPRVQDGFAVPDIARFDTSTSQVDDNLTWSGIRRYKIENGFYQLELKGILTSGKLVPRKTKLQRLMKGNKWQLAAPSELTDKYELDVVTSGNEFTLYLKLPKGQFQVSLFARIDGRDQEYPFQIEANESWPEAPPPAIGRYLCARCADLGLGFNYLSLSHSNVSTLAAINYSAIAVPAMTLQYRQKLSRISVLRAAYSYNKGADFSPKRITMKNSGVATSTLSLSFEQITKPNGVLLGGNYSSGYTYSINWYAFPMVRVLNNSNSLYSIQTFNVYSASAGGFFGMKFGDSELIAQMRFQLPLTATGVTFKGGLSFDGALTYLSGPSSIDTVGGSTKSPTGLYWGVTWGGQYHSYTYALPSEGLSKGSYSVFLSKIEALIGYSF
jgi:hypothetical protein